MKPEFEFFDVSSVEWTAPPDAVPGLKERVLALDSESGVASRMLRFEPGTDTSPNGILAHEFWEEVFILEGEIHDLTLDEVFSAGMYACRPPGMEHGPWVSTPGCTTFEVRYLAPQPIDSS